MDFRVYQPAVSKKRLQKYAFRRGLLQKIILHCSDSDIPAHDTPEIVDDWHLDRGWTGIGYHYLLTKDGIIWKCRPEEYVGSHCYGHNSRSIGICIAGRYRFNEVQYENMIELVLKVLKAHRTKDHKVRVFGHYELSKAKTCPNFDVSKVREELEKRCLKK